MGIFDRFAKKENQPIEGYIGFYGLVDWWLTEFTEEERRYMVGRFKPWEGEETSEKLIKGRIINLDLPVEMFLNNLAMWFKSTQDTSIAERIYKKMDELGTLHPVDKPGNYQGRHYTTYVNEVKELKRAKSVHEEERLLWGLVEAVEAQAKVDGYTLGPFYYEELADIYRKRGDYSKEIDIWERYIENTPKPSKPYIKPFIFDRLAKAKSLANQEEELLDV